MAKHFDLKKQLRLHDKGLLRRLFAEHGLLEDFAWEELSTRRIEPLVARWEGIEESARRAIQVVLQDANELAEERGQRVLADELAWRFPAKLPAFARWSSLADKALWAYLEARKAFDEAALFARAEALRSGQFAARWNSLPPGVRRAAPAHQAARARSPPSGQGTRLAWAAGPALAAPCRSPGVAHSGRDPGIAPLGRWRNSPRLGPRRLFPVTVSLRPSPCGPFLGRRLSKVTPQAPSDQQQPSQEAESSP